MDEATKKRQTIHFSAEFPSRANKHLFMITQSGREKESPKN